MGMTPLGISVKCSSIKFIRSHLPAISILSAGVRLDCCHSSEKPLSINLDVVITLEGWTIRQAFPLRLSPSLPWTVSEYPLLLLGLQYPSCGPIIQHLLAWSWRCHCQLVLFPLWPFLCNLPVAGQFLPQSESLWFLASKTQFFRLLRGICTVYTRS